MSQMTYGGADGQLGVDPALQVVAAAGLAAAAIVTAGAVEVEPPEPGLTVPSQRA